MSRESLRMVLVAVLVCFLPMVVTSSKPRYLLQGALTYTVPTVSSTLIDPTPVALAGLDDHALPGEDSSSSRYAYLPLLMRNSDTYARLGEHPYLLFRRADLPVLRAKADRDVAVAGFQVPPRVFWEELYHRALSYRDTDLLYPAPCPALPWCETPDLLSDTLEQLGWDAPYTWSTSPPPPHPQSPGYPAWTKLTRTAFVQVTTLAVAGTLADDVAMRRRGAEIVLQASQWPVWYDQEAGQSLDIANLVKMAAIAFDVLYHDFTPEERTQIRRAIAEKGVARLLDQQGKPIGFLANRSVAGTNPFVTQATALAYAGVALYGEHPEAHIWLETALELLQESMDAQDPDGGVLEGPYYGNNVTADLAQLGEALARSGLFPEGQSPIFDHPFFQKLARYTVSVADPATMRARTLGDGWPEGVIPNVEAMEVLAVRGDLDAAWFISRLDEEGLITQNLDDWEHNDPDNALTFLRYPLQGLHVDAPEYNPSAAFRDVGYSILRDGYSPLAGFLMFKSGPQYIDVGHNHYDQNSFVLNYRGTPLIVPSGYCPSLGGVRRKICEGTHGQNTLILDLASEDGLDRNSYLVNPMVPLIGHDQFTKTGGRILEFFSSPSLDLIAGGAAPAYRTDLEQFVRTVIFIKPRMWVIHDSVVAERSHDYTILFHGPVGSSFDSEGLGYVLKNSGAALYLQTIASGQLAPRIYAGYPFEEDRRPSTRLFGPFLEVTTARAQNANLITVLSAGELDNAVPQVEISEGGSDGVRLLSDGIDQVIAFNRRQPGPHGEVALPNAGFEGPDLYPWTPRDASFIDIDSQVAYEGQQSVRMDFRSVSGSQNNYLYSPRFRLSPGTQFSCEAMVRTEDATSSSGHIRVIYWRDGNYLSDDNLHKIRSDSNWQLVRLESRVPADADEITCSLQFAGTGGAIWYDRVRVRYDAGPSPRKTKDVRFDDIMMTTDAIVSAVFHDEPAVLRGLFVLDGTYLELNEQRILTASQPVTVFVDLSRSAPYPAVLTDGTTSAGPGISISLSPGRQEVRVGGQTIQLCLAPSQTGMTCH